MKRKNRNFKKFGSFVDPFRGNNPKLLKFIIYEIWILFYIMRKMCLLDNEMQCYRNVCI